MSEEIYNFLQQHIYSLDLPEIKKAFKTLKAITHFIHAIKHYIKN